MSSRGATPSGAALPVTDREEWVPQESVALGVVGAGQRRPHLEQALVHLLAAMWTRAWTGSARPFRPGRAR